MSHKPCRSESQCVPPRPATTSRPPVGWSASIAFSNEVVQHLPNLSFEAQHGAGAQITPFHLHLGVDQPSLMYGQHGLEQGSRCARDRVGRLFVEAQSLLADRAYARSSQSATSRKPRTSSNSSLCRARYNRFLTPARGLLISWAIEAAGRPRQQVSLYTNQSVFFKSLLVNVHIDPHHRRGSPLSKKEKRA